MSLLKVTDLVVSYGGIEALKGISFDVEQGQIVTLIGANGAGKSTLAKGICGFVHEDAGEILYEGQSSRDWTIKERSLKIGYVMQNPNQMISKPMIFDEVALGLRIRGAAEAEAESSAVAAEASRLRSVETKVKDAVADEEREAAKADAIRSLLNRRTLATVRIMAIRSALGNEMWIEKWEGDRVTVRGWSDDLKTLVSRTKTGGSTAAQIIEARLKGSPVVDPASVKIESMTDVGKDAALKQIVVVAKFKFGKGEER
jgi:ABC-type iron transport system FetAB ATPase subunit